MHLANLNDTIQTAVTTLIESGVGRIDAAFDKGIVKAYWVKDLIRIDIQFVRKPQPKPKPKPQSPISWRNDL